MIPPALVERCGNAVERIWHYRERYSRPESDISVLFREYARAAINEYHAALAEQGLAVLPMEATDEMQRAGWIDKEDVNPDEIWRAMARTALTSAEDET